MDRKKKKLTAACAAALLGMILFTACGTDTEEENTAVDSTEEEKTSVDNTGKESTTVDDTEEIQDNIENSVFEELAECGTFTFSSGAGAWSTELNILEDGSFSGMYHDSEAGATGDGYPNGTIYICSFSGKFTTPEQIDEYTWKTTIESISCEEENGKEELADDMKYIYSEPYGLTDAEDIYIYKKGIPVSTLPEGYCSWIYNIDDYQTLPFYGIYNEKGEAGFYNWEEDAGSSDDSKVVSADNPALLTVNGLKETEEKASEIEQKMETDASLMQLDLNEMSKELYTLWDDQLNVLWKQLKETLDTETMSSLTANEKEWIQEKERKIQKAGEAYSGGSLQEQVMNQEGADLTKTRVYELADYL